MKKNLTLIATFLLCLTGMYAQELSIDADIRSRFEYRSGFNNLVPEDSDPAANVQQRSRLKFGYKADKFKAGLGIQDVRVWGDTRQILDNDVNNNLQLAYAWVELMFGTGWSTKVGRQAISYDDQRIFGGLDWALQGRFHDAALLKYKDDKFKLDFGFAFSQDDLAALPGRTTTTLYSVDGFFSYKAMEYVHATIKAGEGNTISLLALNNTFQNRGTELIFPGTFLEDEVGFPLEGFFHRQTFGTHSKFKLGSVKLALNAYLQTGEAAQEVDLSAYLVGLEANTKAGSTGLGLGFEIQSGNDQTVATDGTIQNVSGGENKAFFPLYGTNHKFNGFMDYFYVGNHANNVGLTDIYAKAVFKTGEKSKLLVKGHYFGAAGTLIDDTDLSEADSYLGTEIDVVYTQKLLPYATLNVGYSHMFAGEGMEFLKNQADPASVQNWGWVQLMVKPNFLKWKKPAPTAE